MGLTRGCIWLAAGLVVALLAGVVGFVTLSRGAAGRQAPQAGQVAGPTVKVVTAAKDIPVRSLLSADLLIVKDVPAQVVPEGYLTAIEQAADKMNLTDLAAGEILLADRLVDPDVVAANGRLALIMNDEQVLLAFPANDLMNGLGILKPGDHVDLLFSMPFEDRAGGAEDITTELVTFNALQNVTIAAVVGGQADENGNADQAKALLLTVSPQNALTLKHLKDAGAVMDVVLRAPGAEQPFAADPVDMDRVIRENQIPVGIGQ